MNKTEFVAELLQVECSRLELRVEQLEQLCRDLYECSSQPKCDYCPNYWGDQQDYCSKRLEERLDALGLLEVD